MARKIKNPLKRDKFAVLKEPVLTPDDLAKRWKMSAGTLKNWRAQHAGPPFVALTDGERPPIVYLRSDIEKFEQKQKRAAA